MGESEAEVAAPVAGEAVVEVAGGLRFSVPPSLAVITTYVLREQEAWFEDEWPFLPRVVQPGARVLDIGANHGVYTVALARAVGETGHVWAFEPTPTTMAHLKRSVALNRLANVTLLEAALSDHTGSATLALNESSELNALGGDGSAGGVEVELRTLDRCREEFGWERIDLVKLDAEGEEVNVVRGGRGLFAEESPLVMFELKNGTEVNHGLIEAFESLGYSTYRFVPGVGVLAPFERGAEVDPYQLNLFCCKEGRAAELAAAGWLVAAPQEGEAAGMVAAAEFRALPFVRGVGRGWQGQGDGATLERAARMVCGASDGRLPAAQRLAGVRRAYRDLRRLCATNGSPTRLATLARAAWAWGAREVALEVLKKAFTEVQRTRRVTFHEPFVPPLPRFDQEDPAGAPGRWFVRTLLEAIERRRAFSSYYLDSAGFQLFELLRNFGCPAPEIERRRQLCRMRTGQQHGPEPSPLLTVRRADNLNPGYWQGQGG